MSAAEDRRVARFAVATLAGMLLIGAVAALYVRGVAITDLKAMGMSEHEVLARTVSAALLQHIEPVLRAAPDLEPAALRGLPEVKRLRRFLVDPLHGMRVVRIKIYDRDFRTVFSTEEAQIGERVPGNMNVERALRGDTVAEIAHADTFNVSDGVLEDRDMLETYVPLRAGPGGSVIGVFEAYSDMTPLLERIDASQTRLVSGVLLASGSVFLVLLAMYRRLDRALSRESTAAARYLREVQLARDTLERRVDERTRELAYSEQRFQDVADAAGEYIFETDTRGNFSYLNARVERVLGYSVDELLGRAPLDLAPEEDRMRVRAHFALHGGSTPFTGLEHRSRRKDGGLIWQSVSAVPMYDDDGRFVGHRGAAYDITARRRAESRLRQLSLVIEQSAEMVIITDMQGEMLYVNRAFTEQSGYTALEATGKTPRLLRSGEMDAAVYDELWQTVSEGGTWRGELCNRHKNGTLFWSLVSVFPLRDQDETITHYVGLQSDISARKAGERALQASEARLRAIMDSVTDAIITADLSGRIEMVNPATERLFGHRRDDLVGENIRKLMAQPHRADHDGYVQRYLDTGAGHIIGVGGREVVGVRSDGSEVPLELGVGEVQIDGSRRFVGVLRDLTERKRAERELERTRQQYFHRERIAAMGQLAAGIVHEVGNPAAAISGAVSAVLKSVDADPICDERVIANLELISQQADRLAAMTREISDFARPRETHRGLLDLNQLVRSAASILRYDARIQDLDLKVDLDPDLPAIDGSHDQLTQVALNLVLNACDACMQGPRAGRVAVRTALAAGRAVLMVGDNGVGMDDETLRRALDPYFTTKGEGRGLGLGLPLCNDIIVEHGGRLEIQSVPGAGTTVRVVLPLHSPDGEPD